MKKILSKDTVDIILDKLDLAFPDAKPELVFKTPFELLVAVILSAQCTDVRVNKVTEELFKKANTPEGMLSLGETLLEEEIRSCGFYHNKAKNIIGASRKIIEDFEGKIPDNMEEIMSLPGVGRKTANVVLSVAFGVPAIAVDTHVQRVSNRLGMVKGKNPDETERGLMKCIKKSRWSKAHHLLIFLGRRVCKSRKPNCESCPVNNECMKII